MKKILFLNVFLFSLILGNSFSQQTETWTLVKAIELSQPFGHVWEYNNTPDESHKTCKGHEHSVHPVKTTKPLLKKSFIVTNGSYALKYASTGATGNTKINYSFVDDAGNTVLSQDILFEIDSEKTWNKTNIDLSSFLNQNLTLVIDIKELPTNASLFINLLQ